MSGQWPDSVRTVSTCVHDRDRVGRRRLYTLVVAASVRAPSRRLDREASRDGSAALMDDSDEDMDMAALAAAGDEAAGGERSRRRSPRGRFRPASLPPPSPSSLPSSSSDT